MPRSLSRRFSNMFLLGVAYQKGLVPLTAGAIHEAIRLNGVVVERNLEVFSWGRQHAHEPSVLEPHLGRPRTALMPQSLDGLIEDRERELVAYQSAAYADEYRRVVERVRRAESQVRPGSESLSAEVAFSLHKLMAYKDEYEVARLLSDPAFDREVSEMFKSPRKLAYHLHPPLLRRLGFRRKMAFGPWVRPVLRLLARGRLLRGTALDPFGWMASRREERDLISWYRGLVHDLLEHLDASNLGDAAEIAAAPREIRGYEEIKRQSVERTKAWVYERLASMRAREAA